MQTKLDVLCVIPTLGKDLERLASCVNSARPQLPASSKIVVVWNSIEPYSAEVDNAEIFCPGLNLGYGASVNVVSSLNPSRFIWLVQDDMTFPDKILADFVTLLSSETKLAAVTPAKISSNGTHPMVFRGGDILPGGTLKRPARPRIVSKPGLIDYVELGWIPLGGALIDTSAFDEINGFDLRYFPVGHTDVDLCWRLTEAGYSVGSARDRGSIHQKASSTPGALARYLFNTHGEYFRGKISKQTRELPPVNVPAEVIAVIAQMATTKLIDFASKQHARQQEEPPNKTRRQVWKKKRTRKENRWRRTQS